MFTGEEAPLLRISWSFFVWLFNIKEYFPEFFLFLSSYFYSYPIYSSILLIFWLMFVPRNKSFLWLFFRTPDLVFLGKSSSYIDPKAFSLSSFSFEILLTASRLIENNSSSSSSSGSVIFLSFWGFYLGFWFKVEILSF